jgi:hypothetical protein
VVAERLKKRVVLGPEKAASSTFARGRKSASEVLGEMVKSNGWVAILGLGAWG